MIQTIQRATGYLRPYVAIALGALVALLIVMAANLYTPQLIRSLIDEGITIRSWNGILAATIGLVVVAVVRGASYFLQSYWSEKASQGVAYDFRNTTYRKLATLSFSYYDQNRTGQLLTRITSDVEGVRLFFAQGLLQLISALVTFVGSAIILFITDWRLALASLVTIPAIAFVFVRLFGMLFPRFRQVQQKLGDLNTVLQENLAGVRVVKAFAAEPQEQTRYRQRNEALYDEFLGIVRLFAVGFPAVLLFANVGTVIVIWYGGNLVISNQLSLGSLIAFNTYLAFLLQPIFQLGFISQLLSRASASAERLFEIIDAENELQKHPDAQPLINTRGQVTFVNTRFRYIGASEDVLKGVSFTIEPGQTVAIMGMTASGKSSLVNLIPRFYDATGGSVLVDGHDVRDLTLDSLRSQIGVVLQETNLISGTIRENIAYGQPDATDEAVEQAARAAQAHDFIIAQPQGYNTVVGERGVGLSGGQKQRVAIARAVLINPGILIFDDSTSAVDTETEYKIRQALDTLLHDRTAFIIAQRVSTVRNADLILVLNNGRIAARGTHEELLEHSPLYADILSSQLQDDEAPDLPGAIAPVLRA